MAGASAKLVLRMALKALPATTACAAATGRRAGKHPPLGRRRLLAGDYLERGVSAAAASARMRADHGAQAVGALRREMVAQARFASNTASGSVSTISRAARPE